MKAWFIFLINGQKIGTFANNIDEAISNLSKEYGDISMEYIGNSCYDLNIKADKLTYIGMSPVDILIASRILNVCLR